MLDPFLEQYALPTFEAKNKSNILAYVEAGRVHFPFVLKPRLGTTGEGIVLVKEPKDLDKINNLYTYVIEQYIEPECDYRVFVIGGTAVGIMRKTGDHRNPGDFKIWSSGRNRYPEKDPETISILSDIATRAAAISRLEYTGIDIIKEKGTGKYYLLETNFAAGWGNRFIETTHANIPAFTLDWFEDMEKGREQPVADAVTNYISRRKVFLPTKIQRDYDAILAGDGSPLDSYDSVFAKYPSRHITDAGNLFETLKNAYRDVVDHPDKVSNYSNLVHAVESLPLSWAGCFVGPDVGTLHDGAILSAMYLYLLHKTRKIWYNNHIKQRNNMKKAVILVGGKQYLVAEKETLRVDLLPAGTKELELDALLVIDGDKTTVGTPTVKGVKVSAKVVTPEVKGDKIRVIRYKAKKRVHKETGHRQKYTEIEITKIA